MEMAPHQPRAIAAGSALSFMCNACVMHGQVMLPHAVQLTYRNAVLLLLFVGLNVVVAAAIQ